MKNLFNLHESLLTMRYTHASYYAFTVSDPKTRRIHKASVRDRVLHRALYRVLYPYFDRLFINDSYSCRVNKGVHRALDRFKVLARKTTKNYRKPGWVLKCDIRKFFASVDQKRLLVLLDEQIGDKRIVDLLEKILVSFSAGTSGTGLPLGNLTSQLFSNVYMNQFDQFVKRELRIKHYIRYADDFVFFGSTKEFLASLIPAIGRFLMDKLSLELHPKKIELRSIYSGVDFLGFVHFPHHRVLRTVTRRKMIKRLKESSTGSRRASYLGLLGHGNTKRLVDELAENDLFW